MNKENLVEKAMLQMKEIEDLVAENAKGILASTMKEEINSLVQESLLSEQALEDEDEVVLDPENSELEMDADDVDLSAAEEVPDMGDETDEMDFEDETSDDEDVLDLRDVDDEATLLTVFKAMKDDDGIIVSKSGEDIHLKDENSDNEYLIKLGESIKKRRLMEEKEMDEGWDDYSDSFRADRKYDDPYDNEEWDEEDEEEEYDEFYGDMGESEDASEEDEMTEEFEEEMSEGWHQDNMSEEEDDEEEDEEMSEGWDMDEEENLYEIDMDDDDDYEQFGDIVNYSIEDLGKMIRDKEKPTGSKFRASEEYDINESKKKMTVKPKGVGMGTPNKFKFKKKPNQDGGFDEKMKEAPKSKGTGKAKFEYKKGENMEGKMKPVHTKAKKEETKEAARTYAMGPKENGGLRKGVTPNRNHVYENEIKELRLKNEEYRKALNTFRDKLTEVAVFNSNLAYATRLFTEHSTTKKEKINILRRFDDVQTLKESKTLYNAIKNELNESVKDTIKESVAIKINNAPSNGSSVNLIESTTYESPQFLRMKDLMNKLK